MYLIHFHIKNNIYLLFPKSYVLKLQIHTFHSSLRDEINCVGISKNFSIECNNQIFKSKQIKCIHFIFNNKKHV